MLFKNCLEGGTWVVKAKEKVTRGSSTTVLLGTCDWKYFLTHQQMEEVCGEKNKDYIQKYAFIKTRKSYCFAHFITASPFWYL